MGAHLPHTMLERVRWQRALAYAQCLKPGDEIIDSIDGEYVESFRALLPLALEAHGLRLEGTIVQKINEQEGRA